MQSQLALVEGRGSRFLRDKVLPAVSLAGLTHLDMYCSSVLVSLLLRHECPSSLRTCWSLAFSCALPVDFMMRFELGLGDKPDTSRPFTSALAVGGSYVVGGLVPLLPVRVMRF